MVIKNLLHVRQCLVTLSRTWTCFTNLIKDVLSPFFSKLLTSHCAYQMLLSGTFQEETLASKSHWGVIGKIKMEESYPSLRMYKDEGWDVSGDGISGAVRTGVTTGLPHTDIYSFFVALGTQCWQAPSMPVIITSSSCGFPNWNPRDNVCGRQFSREIQTIKRSGSCS